MTQQMKAKAAFVFVVFGFALSAIASASTKPTWSDYPALQGIERSTVSHGGQRLDVLVRRDGQQPRPVLVLLSGSVCMPAFMAIESDEKNELVTSAMLPKPPTQSAMGVHLAVLERRNIVSLDRFFETADTSPLKHLAERPCTQVHGGVTLEQRVEDTLAQLAHIRMQSWAGEILLAGMSEGADVAAAVAAEPSSKVHSLLMLSGAGMSQFFDFINGNRNKGDAAGAARAFADMDAFLRNEQPARYLGYDAQRWRSFTIETTPMESLLSSQMPLFIVQGDQDTSVPIASIDATVVEVMRKQPQRAIYYWPIKGAEHDLRAGESRPADTIYPEFVRWVLSRPSGRRYRDD